jgi:hypothetical protein
MCCVHNGIITEDDVADYKKAELPKILAMKSGMGEGITASDITFSEVGKVSDEVVPIE